MGSAEANRDFPDQDQRAAFCNSQWERKDMESIFAIDNFVNVREGEPFRLLPFGPLVKGGDKREITPEMAQKFRLPHYKPAIKIGSHKQEAPAAGHIRQLFIGEDGLYALPEFTDKGMKVVQEGDYKYQSPEIVWEGGMEDPKTGDMIEAPLIVGAALLHDPHLGEDAALYQAEGLDDTHRQKETNMSETVEVPKTFWDSVVTFFQAPEKDTEEVQPEKDAPEVDIEKFEAIKSERDEYQAKLDEMEAQAEREQLMSDIRGEFDTDEYGAAFQEMPESDETIEMLVGMDEEQREWVLTQFRAMSKQIDESALTGEEGTSGEGVDADNPREKLNAVVEAKAKEESISYNEALSIVSNEQPELVNEAYGRA